MEVFTNRTATLPSSFRPLTMLEGMRAAMRRTPDKIAVVHGAEHRSYRNLIARMDRVTDATLANLAVSPGETVAIVSHNNIPYIEIVCGVPEAGVPVATINPRLTPAEIALICEDAKSKVVFADSALAAAVRAACPGRRVIEIGPQYEAWLTEAGSSSNHRPKVEEWDTWTIPYTSGTTGRPKGVMVSHRSRILTFLGMAAEYGCYGPDDHFLGLTPMNHGAGMCFSLAILYFGGMLELLDRYDAERVLRLLKQGTSQGPFTGVFMVPTHFHSLFALSPAVLAANRDAPIRTIICNAAPLPQALKQQIVDYFGGGVLHETYGSTEGGIVTNLRPADQLRKQRCVGLAFPNTFVRLLDDTGREVPPGEIGELFSASPYLFNGYWNQPQSSADTFRDGWVTVGDLAKRDSEGFIYIVDRKKDMVISGGVNIYPREIEEVLSHHPAIADIAVVGIPDDKWGEALKAFVVLKPSATLSVQDMAEFCKDRLAPYKIPKAMATIAALPRNASGKVLKAALRCEQ